MSLLLGYLLLILIVGFVTAGIRIRFDRFFTLLLLLFLMKFNIFESVNIFLWVIMLGAFMIILQNLRKILNMSLEMKVKIFMVIPFLTFLATFLGTLLFIYSPAAVLLAVLGFLAVFYGLRLVFIHFDEYDMKLKKEHPLYAKLCGVFGPIISGFSVSYIGTSLKPLKVPFGVRVGRMNLKQVYLGNVITAFYSALFAIFWHFILAQHINLSLFFKDTFYGLVVFIGIHFVYEITNMFIFRENWRKGFQIFIGYVLILVSLKLFLMAI